MNRAGESPIAWHLCSNRWNSAVTEYAISTARALRLLGYHSVFTALKNSPAAKRAVATGLEVVTIEAFDWRHLTALRSIAKKLQPALIFLNGGPETTLSQFLSITPACKLVRIRGVDFDESLSFQIKHRLAHRHVHQIVVPGQALATKLGTAIGRRVTPITLGCDAKVYAPDAIAISGSRPVLLTLGRLDPVKGHERLLGLFKSVLERWPAGTPKPLLEVIGEAANVSAASLRAFGSALGLVYEDDWRLIDRRISDVAKTMSAATLGIVSSLGSELICRVAEEFLLCGTPVAVSGVGSLAEVLFDDTAGFNFQNMTSDDIVTNLIHWLTRSLHESHQEKLARATAAKEIFSLEAMAAAYALLLRRL